MRELHHHHQVIGHRARVKVTVSSGLVSCTAAQLVNPELGMALLLLNLGVNLVWVWWD